MAEKYGMKLVYKTPFAEFFNKHVENRDHKNLLSRMQALEVNVWDQNPRGECEKSLKCILVQKHFFALNSQDILFIDSYITSYVMCLFKEQPEWLICAWMDGFIKILNCFCCSLGALKQSYIVCLFSFKDYG